MSHSYKNKNLKIDGLQIENYRNYSMNFLFTII